MSTRSLDGTAIPVKYRAEPIVTDGQLEGAICTFSDITERRPAEVALAASEAEFRTFAQAVPNHVWASSPEGQLYWFNNQAYEYGGVGHGELDGSGWVEMGHPEDRAGASARWATALASGQTYETEFRLRRADGAWRWRLARAAYPWARR